MKYGRAWIALLLIAILTPLGIIAVGGAWGEWDRGGIKERVGFIPEGMRASTDSARSSPFEDYAVPGFERGFWRERIGTIIAACAGAGATALAAYAVGWALRRGSIS
jgi:ABC-type Fe3+ transport system permease subunit